MKIITVEDIIYIKADTIAVPRPKKLKENYINSIIKRVINKEMYNDRLNIKTVMKEGHLYISADIFNIILMRSSLRTAIRMISNYNKISTEEMDTISVKLGKLWYNVNTPSRFTPSLDHIIITEWVSSKELIRYINGLDLTTVTYHDLKKIIKDIIIAVNKEDFQSFKCEEKIINGEHLVTVDLARLITIRLSTDVSLDVLYLVQNTDRYGVEYELARAKDINDNTKELLKEARIRINKIEASIEEGLERIDAVNLLGEDLISQLRKRVDSLTITKDGLTIGVF